MFQKVRKSVGKLSQLLLALADPKAIYIVCVITAIVYIPYLSHGFSNLLGDDNWMLYNNPYLEELNVQNIVLIFSTVYNGQISPVNTLCYLIIYQLFGMTPFWFHLFSLTIHLLNVYLVYKFLSKLLSFPIFKTQIKRDRIPLIALISAFLYGINPLNVESVAWISASKILLYSAFYWLSVIGYLKFLALRKRRFYVISIVFFVLSCLSKEEAVILPATLLLINLFYFERRERRKSWPYLVPFLLVSIGFGIISLWAQDIGFATKLDTDYYSIGQRLVLACYAFSKYIFMGVLPLGFSYFYPFPVAPGEALPIKYYFYVFFILSTIVIFINALINRNYLFVFLSSFFVINLFLSLHIIPMARGNIMAHRYLYVSLVSVTTLLSFYSINFGNIYRYTLLWIYMGCLIWYTVFLSSFNL